jgi:CRP/FNR family transcriptional regulator
MSHDLNDEDKFLLRLNNMNSAQRLSSFLLDLSLRFEKRGLSGRVFDLSMTRVNITHYLGMAIETTSRLLTQLQNEQVIKLKQRRVSIVDFENLNLCLLHEREPYMLDSAHVSQTNIIEFNVD